MGWSLTHALLPSEPSLHQYAPATIQQKNKKTLQQLHTCQTGAEMTAARIPLGDSCIYGWHTKLDSPLNSTIPTGKAKPAQRLCCSPVWLCMLPIAHPSPGRHHGPGASGAGQHCQHAAGADTHSCTQHTGHSLITHRSLSHQRYRHAQRLMMHGKAVQRTLVPTAPRQQPNKHFAAELQLTSRLHVAVSGACWACVWAPPRPRVCSHSSLLPQPPSLTHPRTPSDALPSLSLAPHLLVSMRYGSLRSFVTKSSIRVPM